MADFTKWGCAIAESLGYTQDDFLTAYYTKIEESNMNAIDANPVAGLIVDLMANRDDWLGTPTELYNDLLDILSRDGARAENVRGLTSPRALGKIHDRLSPNLRKIGIDWRILPRNKKGRKHQIVKSNPTTPMGDKFFGGGKNSGDDNDDNENTRLIAFGDDKNKGGDDDGEARTSRPIVVGVDKGVGDVCSPYLSFFKKGGDREDITIGAQTSPTPASTPIDSSRDDPNKKTSTPSPEASTPIDSSGHDSCREQTSPQSADKHCDESTGQAIIEFIENKMKSYGSFETDHKFDVISSSLEDSGYNMDDIKFCIHRYREGHRIFHPPTKEA